VPRSSFFSFLLLILTLRRTDEIGDSRARRIDMSNTL
jgi:hypothetical protein